MIEKVGYTKPTSATKATRRTGSVEGAAFASALEEAEGVAGVKATSAASGVGAVGGLGGLLGINEVNDQDVRRRKAVKKGRFTLEALEQLRNGLLMGSVPLSVLRNLERMVAEERDTIHDPALLSILDDIELRAAVEMAKLEMSGVLPRPE